MCNNEAHDLLIQEDYVNCVFCDKQIQDPGKPERYFCCESMKLMRDNLLVCKNCGQVHDYGLCNNYLEGGVLRLIGGPELKPKRRVGGGKM